MTVFPSACRRAESGVGVDRDGVGDGVVVGRRLDRVGRQGGGVGCVLGHGGTVGTVKGHAEAKPLGDLRHAPAPQVAYNRLDAVSHRRKGTRHGARFDRARSGARQVGSNDLSAYASRAACANPQVRGDTGLRTDPPTTHLTGARRQVATGRARGWRRSPPPVEVPASRRAPSRCRRRRRARSPTGRARTWRTGRSGARWSAAGPAARWSAPPRSGTAERWAAGRCCPGRRRPGGRRSPRGRSRRPRPALFLPPGVGDTVPPPGRGTKGSPPFGAFAALPALAGARLGPFEFGVSPPALTHAATPAATTVTSTAERTPARTAARLGRGVRTVRAGAGCTSAPRGRDGGPRRSGIRGVRRGVALPNAPAPRQDTPRPGAHPYPAPRGRRARGLTRTRPRGAGGRGGSPVPGPRGQGRPGAHPYPRACSRSSSMPKWWAISCTTVISVSATTSSRVAHIRSVGPR